jgi:hypothetical protein
MKRWTVPVVIYALLGGGVVLGWAAKTAFGYEIGSAEERLTIPADQRRSPGGYRSFVFWYSGYHGGK